VWNLKDTRSVLYRLPQALEAIEAGTTILVAEGEHDADALARAGAVATTHPLGAANWRTEYSRQLAGAKVALVIDRDDTGHKRAMTLVLEFGAAGIEVVAVYEPVEGVADVGGPVSVRERSELIGMLIVAAVLVIAGWNSSVRSTPPPPAKKNLAIH
jgi:DNA primase